MKRTILCALLLALAGVQCSMFNVQWSMLFAQTSITPEVLKTKDIAEQIEYQLDEQQMVRQMKSDVTSDENDWHYDYHIKWVTPSTLH